MSDAHRNAMHQGHAHRARVSIEVGDEFGAEWARPGKDNTGALR